MEKFLESIGAKATDLCIKVLIALIVVGVGFKIIKILSKSMKKKHKFSKLDESTKGFLISFINNSLKCIVIIIAIGILGIPTSSIITVIGSCGIAIGLALQGGLSNIASGIMILIFKPFKVGDYINTHTDEGTVIDISLFYTTLCTIDNRHVMIPNGVLSSSVIVNYTACKTRRIDLEIAVSYDTKIDKVKNIINKILDNHKLILKDKERVVRVMEHSDSAIIFAVKSWVNTDDYWNVRYDLLETIKEEFDKNNIEIPYNQLDIHMKK